VTTYNLENGRTIFIVFAFLSTSHLRLWLLWLRIDSVSQTAGFWSAHPALAACHENEAFSCAAK
jgi:hypothetical protein